MMTAEPRAPSHDTYAPLSNSIDPPNSNREYAAGLGTHPNSVLAGSSIQPSDFQVRGVPPDTAPAAQQSRFHEDFSSSRRGSSVADGRLSMGDSQRSDSQMSLSHPAALPSRTNSMLKKKASLNKKGSLRRGGSKRSSRAGSVKSLNLGEKEKYGVGDGDEVNSAFYVPIPTKGSPTDILAARFQGMQQFMIFYICALQLKI